MRYMLSPGTAVEHVPTLRRELSPVNDYFAFVRVSAMLREFRPQIIHTHMAKAGAIGRAAAALYNRSARPSERARIVHTYHGHVLRGYFNPVVSRFFLLLERTLATQTTRLIAVGPEVRDDLVAFGVAPVEQFSVIRLGIDLDTSHFTGNFPPAASIEACCTDSQALPHSRVLGPHPATSFPPAAYWPSPAAGADATLSGLGRRGGRWTRGAERCSRRLEAGAARTRRAG